MTATPKPTMGRLALWLLPALLVPVAFIAIAPWLKSIDRTLFNLATAATSIFVMSYSVYVSIRWQRGLDEVEQANQGFGVRWGMTAGTMAFVLLLMLPPIKNFATTFVIEFGNPGPGMTMDRSVVVFAMMLGFAGVVLLQGIGTVVFSAIWWRSKQ